MYCIYMHTHTNTHTHVCYIHSIHRGGEVTKMSTNKQHFFFLYIYMYCVQYIYYKQSQ